MDAVAAGRPVWLADQVVRLYAGHRVAQLRDTSWRMAGGDLGPQEDAERVPCRVGRGRVCFLASGFRSGGRWALACCCPHPILARGAYCMR